MCADYLRALLAAASPNAKPPRIAAVDAAIEQVSAGSNRAFIPAGGWFGSIQLSDERTREIIVDPAAHFTSCDVRMGRIRGTLT